MTPELGEILVEPDSDTATFNTSVECPHCHQPFPLTVTYPKPVVQQAPKRPVGFRP